MRGLVWRLRNGFWRWWYAPDAARWTRWAAVLAGGAAIVVLLLRLR